VQFYMFFIFVFFYLILEKMSANGRKFRFSFYIWHLWRRVLCIIDPFLCCHLLYLIIYLEEFNLNPMVSKCALSTVKGFNLNLLVRKCVLCTVKGFNLNLLVRKCVLCTVKGFNLIPMVSKCALSTVKGI